MPGMKVKINNFFNFEGIVVTTAEKTNLNTTALLLSSTYLLFS